MAKLRQVIGAILSDISNAQSISDAYSRDLKHSYREDQFLKLISVPRTQIKDVTIELKFAILKEEKDTISKDKLIESKVAIYQHFNYEGASQELSEGNYDITSLSIGDKALSSLKVPKGMKVTLYEGAGFTGRAKVLTEDTPALEDFNDLTSSIKVEKIVDIESMEIEVVTDYLANLPEAAISSISIKLDMTSV